jgi:hypothetical protein
MNMITKRKQAVTAAEAITTAATEAQHAAALAAEAKRAVSEAERAARQAAKEAADELTEARITAQRWTTDAEKQLAAALAELAEDPFVSVAARGPAREALHAGDLLAGLGGIAGEDYHVRALHAVWSAAQRAIRDSGVNGLQLDADDAVVLAADRVECAAWRAMIERVRVCAGESA